MSAGDLLMYGAARSVVGFSAALPLPLALALARAAGSAAFRLDRRHRAIAAVNLAIAFPERPPEDRLRLARGSYENMGEMLVHVGRFPRWLRRERLTGLVRYENPEEYMRFKESGRPVIFLTAHLGGWELMAFSHAVLHRPIQFIYRPLGRPRLDEWLFRRRSLSGNTPVPKREALRQVLQALSRGEDVGILADQNVQPQDGVFVDFFGRRACMTAAPAVLAQRRNAEVIPVFLVPDPAGPARFTIHMLPALPVRRSGDFAADVRENSGCFAGAIEAAVRRWPDRWLWGHRRWRTRPPDDPDDPYAGI
jgi:KDO2-lipid IV(A) lauroyltransferase